jgi:hypothetical protein
MSYVLRHTADHITTETNQEVEVKIYDSLFEGSASKLKGTGSGWLSYTHQNLNPRQTLSQPIQKGEVKASVWIQNAGHRQFRDDLLRSGEGRFKMELYIEGSLEWTGYVLPDLCSYSEDVPEQLSITAKDFSLLKKDLFPLEDERETIITTIERILSSLDFDIDIVTSTSWIEDNTTSGNDFLRQIYHETKALRDFADPDQQITYEEALNRILRNYGLILKQSGGKFRIDQITAYEDGSSVLRSVYDSGFVSQSTINARQTVSPITIDSDNKGNPGLKRVRNTFDHRTQTGLPTLPTNIFLNQQTPFKEFTFQVVPDDESVIRLGALVTATTQDEFNQDGEAQVDTTVRIGQYYWDGDEWTETPSNFTSILTPRRSGSYIGSVNIVTDPIPSDATTPVIISFAQAELSLYQTDETTYSTVSLEISTEGISESITYQVEQLGDFTEIYTHPVTNFGDGPLISSPSALRYGTDDEDLTANTWQRRGGGVNRSMHSNLLHEIMDANRSWRRIINATIKDYLLAYQIVRYEDTDFFYLGGTFDGYTGTWTAQLFEISITDQDEEIVTLITQRLGVASDLGEVVNLSIRDLRRILGLVNGVGVITRDYDNEQTESVEVDLDAPMRVGFDYWVINVNQLSSRDRKAGIYQVEPTGALNQEYTGKLTVPIDEQIIDAPEGSLIVLAPGQQAQADNKVDERVREGEANIISLGAELDGLELELDNLNDVVIPALNAELDNLNDTVIPGINSNISTLDGYFDDPATIPSGYGFFPGIVASNVFTEALVAKTAFVEQLAALNLFANTIVANTTFTDVLAANSAFVDSIVANDTFTDNLIAKTAWVDALIANMIDVRNFYANEATIGAALQMGTGAIIHSANFNGTFDSNGVITANGTLGYAIDSAGKAVFNSVVVRNGEIRGGDIFDSLDVKGTLTMGSGGLITNGADNYRIDDTGIRIKTGDTLGTSITFQDFSAGLNYGRIGSTTTNFRLTSNNNANIVLDSAKDVQIAAAIDSHVIIATLQDTVPSGSNRLYFRELNDLVSTDKVVCIT